MYGFDSLFLVGGLLLLFAPLLAIIALVKTSNLRYEVARLHRLMREMQTQLAQLRESPETPAEPAASTQPAPAVPEKAAPPERTVAPPPAATSIVAEEPPSPPVRSNDQPATPPPGAGAPPYRPTASGPFRQENPAKPREGLEEKLFSRWFGVLGALAISLSVVFFVRHAYQSGWLTPATQCFMGALLGMVLIAAGEYLRRNPLAQAAGFVRPSIVPPALTGAGVSALFVSIYAAYALYELLPPLVAFGALGVVWVLAMLLSILHGPFVAVLGILGGFVVPILVQTGHPSAYGLFPYVLVVTGAALCVLRYMGWAWLAWGALAGAAGWPLIWLVAQPAADVGAPVVGAYLTATAALFIYAPAGLKPHDAPFTLKTMFGTIPPPAVLGWVASALMLVLALLLTWADDFAWGSIVWVGLLTAFLMVAGRRDVTFDALSLGAATMAGLVLLSWDLPFWPGEIDVLSTLPPGLVPYVLTAVCYAGLFGAAGFLLLRGAARPGLWAGLSAGAPVAILAIAYARIKGFEVDLAWASMGLALAAVNLVAAMIVARKRGEPGMEGALAAYAVGVVGSLSLAFAMSMENAWLTVALALQLPAIGWIHERTRVGPLRAVAMLLAMIILGRLVLNPEVLDYGLTAMPGLNWMFYAYGIPTVAFYAAARLFRRVADDALVLALESGALVFLTLFATMEIADIVQAGAVLPGGSLLEASLRTIAWLTIAFALLYQCRAEKPRVVAVWGWQILALLSGGHIFMVHLFGLNPLMTYMPVGPLWIFNLLLLAYAVPAGFAVAFHRETSRQKHPTGPAIAGIAALVLTFVWITLEVRHAFHGNMLTQGWTTDAEWYAYSAAWLFYGAVLMVLGVWRENIALIRASAAVLLLSICKVVLFDMSEVGVLYKAGVLLLLGLSLVVLVMIYNRFAKSSIRSSGGVSQNV